jgi:glyoxylase-like metal-dependent hydrolase (beta-lactamase superfamily II)
MDDWRIGDIRITRILEMCDPFWAPSEWFPDCTAEALAPHLHWLAPRSISPATGQLIFPIQSFLVRTRRHTILVDSCVGNDKTFTVIPRWHRRSDGAFLERLAHAGVAPEQIDYVLCTHLHVDHCGWNTRLVDGRWVPTFPNARYIMARREFEASKKGSGNPDVRTYEDNVLPIVEAGRAVLVDMDHELDDEVRLEPTPGHTLGHVAVGLRSRGMGAVFPGDVMHWPMQCIYPDWNFRYDADPDQARRTRWAFLEACSDDGRIVMPSHFPLPSVGTISRRHASFRFDDYQPP